MAKKTKKKKGAETKVVDKARAMKTKIKAIEAREIRSIATKLIRKRIKAISKLINQLSENSFQADLIAGPNFFFSKTT